MLNQSPLNTSVLNNTSTGGLSIRLGNSVDIVSFDASTPLVAWFGVSDVDDDVSTIFSTPIQVSFDVFGDIDRVEFGAFPLDIYIEERILDKVFASFSNSANWISVDGQVDDVLITGTVPQAAFISTREYKDNVAIQMSTGRNELSFVVGRIQDIVSLDGETQYQLSFSVTSGNIVSFYGETESVISSSFSVGSKNDDVFVDGVVGVSFIASVVEEEDTVNTRCFQVPIVSINVQGINDQIKISTTNKPAGVLEYISADQYSGTLADTANISSVLSFSRPSRVTAEMASQTVTPLQFTR